MLYGVLSCVLVGLLWGATNPLIKRGSVLVAEKKAGAARRGWLSEWGALLSTPSFLVPQLLNQCGGLLFVVLLGGADISTAVPVANATSLAANAVVDLLLGERYKLRYLIPGLVLVAIGLVLCTLK